MELPETNLTLIARMKDPVDQRAWQEFVGAYEPFLLRMLIRRGLMDADARDVVQQIFLAVCRSLSQWTPMVLTAPAVDGCPGLLVTRS